jgi:hypothetical protein
MGDRGLFRREDFDGNHFGLIDSDSETQDCEGDDVFGQHKINQLKLMASDSEDVKGRVSSVSVSGRVSSGKTYL